MAKIRSKEKIISPPNKPDDLPLNNAAQLFNQTTFDLPYVNMQEQDSNIKNNPFIEVVPVRKKSNPIAITNPPKFIPRKNALGEFKVGNYKTHQKDDHNNSSLEKLSLFSNTKNGTTSASKPIEVEVSGKNHYPNDSDGVFDFEPVL